MSEAMTSTVLTPRAVRVALQMSRSKFYRLRPTLIRDGVLVEVKPRYGHPVYLAEPVLQMMKGRMGVTKALLRVEM